MRRSSRSRRNVAERISESRFCACPMLPECMTTNGSTSSCSRAQSLSRARGVNASTSTQFGITTTLPGSRALLGEPRAHRLADRDDAVGALEVEADRVAQRCDDDRVVEPLQLDRDLGEDVLADHDERRAEPARRRAAQRRRSRAGRSCTARRRDARHGARSRATARGTSSSSSRAARGAAGRTRSTRRGRSRRRRGAPSPVRFPGRPPSRPSRRSPRPAPRRAATAAAPSPRPPASSTG